jgi:hypothetical protein
MDIDGLRDELYDAHKKDEDLKVLRKKRKDQM